MSKKENNIINFIEGIANDQSKEGQTLPIQTKETTYKFSTKNNLTQIFKKYRNPLKYGRVARLIYRTNERNYYKCFKRQEKICAYYQSNYFRISACLNSLTLLCIMLKNGQTHLKN